MIRLIDQVFCITIKVILEKKTTFKNVWLPLEYELQFKEFSSIVLIKAGMYLMTMMGL